jgi:carbonic anhydrase/acetyltransferase-like protein (isoleucine patch superfamily)
MLRPFRSRLPKVHSTAFVDQSAQIIGDVEIGDESSIWMNVVVRGDVNSIRIGSRTNIQDGTVVHAMRGTHQTTIGNEVTVGHAAILHGCTIHDRVLIGMGALLLNGAEIGEDSIVAAGTLVPEEKTFPARSLLMGRPAVRKRDLTDQEVSSIKDFAQRYIGYRLDYMPAAAKASARLRRRTKAAATPRRRAHAQRSRKGG